MMDLMPVNRQKSPTVLPHKIADDGYSTLTHGRSLKHDLINTVNNSMSGWKKFVNEFNSEFRSFHYRINNWHTPK